MDAPSLLDVAHLPCAQLPPVIAVPPLRGPFDVAITPPGSKSLTNRALLLAALADGESTLRNPLIEADDTRVMIAALRALGADIRTGSDPPATPGATEPSDTLRIRGVGGRWRVPPEGVTLNLENAGTAVRFLTAAAILAGPGSGPITIDGDTQMRRRPIGGLADALGQLGVRVEFLGRAGCPPLRVTPPANLSELGREVALRDPESSQFVSAIMLITPFLAHPTTIHLHGTIPSGPYIAMSQGLLGRLRMSQGGGRIAGKLKGGSILLAMPASPIRAFTLDIEPDASGAVCFAGACVLTPRSRLLLPGLSDDEDESLQGDVGFFDVVRGFGGFVDKTREGAIVRPPPVRIAATDWDFGPIPDTAMVAAVLACFASPTTTDPVVTTTLRGLRTLRVKESDRVAGLRTELSKLGARVEIETADGDEVLRVTPPSRPDASTPRLVFETYTDHRMAMSLALVGLRRPNVFISNPACVAKTYPTFWRDLARLYTAAP